MVLSGECEVDHVYLREYAAPDVWTADFHCSDARLNELFAAGRECYRANAIDTVSGQSHARARRVALRFAVLGERRSFAHRAYQVEQNQFENYMLPDQFADMPDGMLPTCYPSDHLGGNFVTQWPLWFILQLEQYLEAQRRPRDG